MAAMRIARTGLGTVYLLAPEWIPGALAVPVDHRARIVVRILGARYLAQAFLVSSALGRRYALAMGAAVDVIHAASMVALAAVDVRRRRLAMADAGRLSRSPLPVGEGCTESPSRMPDQGDRVISGLTGRGSEFVECLGQLFAVGCCHFAQHS